MSFGTLKHEQERRESCAGQQRHNRSRLAAQAWGQSSAGGRCRRAGCMRSGARLAAERGMCERGGSYHLAKRPAILCISLGNKPIIGFPHALYRLGRHRVCCIYYQLYVHFDLDFDSTSASTRCSVYTCPSLAVHPKGSIIRTSINTNLEGQTPGLHAYPMPFPH